MSRALDLNAIEQPTLDITMRDKDRTVFHLSVPSVEFVEELQALDPVIAKMKKGNNAVESVKQLFGFFAKIFSHNEDGIQVTAEDLRDRYKLNLLHIFSIYGEYMAFIDEIKNAKN